MSGTVLNFESYRSELDDARARRIAARLLESPFDPSDSGRERVLSERQLAHRRQMLGHL
jgi:hypothetical protein